MLAFQDIAVTIKRRKHEGAAKRGETTSTAVAEANDEGEHAVAAIEF